MRFSVTSSPRVRFSVECIFPHLGKRGAASRKSAFCGCGTTEKRILQPAPHGKAHSATQQSPRARLFVRARPRVRFSVECAFPHLGKRDATSRKSAFSNRRLTEKRTLQPLLDRRRHGKAQSATGASRKAHSAISRRAKLRLFVRQPSQSAPLAPRDTQCHRIRRGHLPSL